MMFTRNSTHLLAGMRPPTLVPTNDGPDIKKKRSYFVLILSLDD